MKRILITGASGGIGARLRMLLPPIYDDIQLSDIAVPENLAPNERFIAADLSDLQAVEAAVDGVDGIIHLGGHSVEGSWETILQANIIGAYNLFEAARRHKVKRIVFASSNHAVGFYPRSEKFGVDVLPMPDTRYGVSKVFGESMAALYAMKHGIGILCVRIGNVSEKPSDIRQLAIWLKPEDLVSLIRIGLEREDLVYEVVYGISDNAAAFWDNARAIELGYRPQGKSQDFADEILKAHILSPRNDVSDYFQGRSFCATEFSADLDSVKTRA